MEPVALTVTGMKVISTPPISYMNTKPKYASAGHQAVDVQCSSNSVSLMLNGQYGVLGSGVRHLLVLIRHLRGSQKLIPSNGLSVARPKGRMCVTRALPKIFTVSSLMNVILHAAIAGDGR